MKSDRNHYEDHHQENQRRAGLGLRLKMPPPETPDEPPGAGLIVAVGITLAFLTVFMAVAMLSA